MSTDLAVTAQEMSAGPPGELAAVLSRDQQVIHLWLHGLSRHTARAYLHDLHWFLELIAQKPLASVTLADVQRYAEWLAAPARKLCQGSRHRALAAIKSLFRFATRLGYLALNPAQPLRLPAAHDALNVRYLEPPAVQALIAAATPGRDRALICLLYYGGLRISEAVGLHWRDLRPRNRGGQVTVTGKGDKIRTVLLGEAEWGELCDQPALGPEWPVFSAQDARRAANRAGIGPVHPGNPAAATPPPEGGADVRTSPAAAPLSACQAWRIIKIAAARAGITQKLSPHWLRHCHASHALDGGAPLHVLQATLGHANIATTSRYLHARPQESSGAFLAAPPPRASTPAIKTKNSAGQMPGGRSL